RDIRRFMRALSEFGLRRGNWAGIGCDDIYIHWVLLLAFERLTIATASLHKRELGEAQRLLASLDIGLSEWDFPGASIRRNHPITPEWIQHVRGLSEIDQATLPPKESDDIVRILRTTGTTGSPKLLRSPRRTQEAWANTWILSVGLTDRSRYLIMIPLDVPA